MGQPFALDFGAVMLVGMAADVDLALLQEVLPAVESAILLGSDDEGGDA
ncbi:hypothetical protein GGR39_002349 [Novosphingobium fluoreni]|uniref:Uncharacterized protein n=1 Tax=Novosphingobium fluoreni TaxID=1391222 RepID=A0A7W6C966_9SPHN|nr:hypothetical protein [Novosphingobium fluoreni]MBB3940692.1 hypothetical protein [Novosphingobium fluoreni]